MDEFLRKRPVSRDIAQRVRKYYALVISRDMQQQENDIIEGLSSSLRAEVVLFLYRSALEAVPFFSAKHP